MYRSHCLKKLTQFGLFSHITAGHTQYLDSTLSKYSLSLLLLLMFRSKYYNTLGECVFLMFTFYTFLYSSLFLNLSAWKLFNINKSGTFFDVFNVFSCNLKHKGLQRRQNISLQVHELCGSSCHNSAIQQMLSVVLFQQHPVFSLL